MERIPPAASDSPGGGLTGVTESRGKSPAHANPGVEHEHATDLRFGQLPFAFSHHGGYVGARSYTDGIVAVLRGASRPSSCARSAFRPSAPFVPRHARPRLDDFRLAVPLSTFHRRSKEPSS